MKRRSFPRRLAAVWLLLALLLAGCTGEEGKRYGYTMPEGSGFEPSGLVVGIDANGGCFYSFPLIDTLRKVLPEEMPLYVAAWDETGALQVWDRAKLDAMKGYADFSDALGRGGGTPSALAQGILNGIGQMDTGENPLVLILSRREDADLGNRYAAAAEIGVQLGLCRMGDSGTGRQAAADTVTALRQIGELLNLQTVALRSDSAGSTAFTLPDLGTQHMALLISGSYNSLSYEGNDITGEQNSHGFEYSDDSLLYVMGYQTDRPGAGDYVLDGAADTTAWLCLRHSLDVDWQLWPETGAHVVAGEAMRLQARLMQDGRAIALPKDLTAECEVTIDGASVSLPMTGQTDRFYQWRSRKLVSAPFTVQAQSQYMAALTVTYPDFGSLTFRHNRGYGLTMGNFAPYLRTGDTIRWEMEAEKVFTPDELFADPEGGSVTIQQAEAAGGIQASLSESGNLYLKADHLFYAAGTVTLLASDENLGIYRQTVQVRYMLLPWWVLYLIAGLFCAIYFAVNLCKDETEIWYQVFLILVAAVCGAIWPVTMSLLLITRSCQALQAARKRKKARRKNDGSDAGKQSARQTRAQERRERKEKAKSRRLDALKQQVQAEKSDLQQLEEQMRHEKARLRKELDIYDWVSAADPQSCAKIYLRAHPEAAQALAQFPAARARYAAEQLDAWFAQLEELYPLRYDTGSSRSMKNACDKLRAYKRRLPEDVQSVAKQLRLDGAVAALYTKFHTEPTGAEPPILVKVAAAGRTEPQYLGCSTGTDGFCRLGEIQMSGPPHEPDKRLAELAQGAQDVYLLPSVQHGRQGYEVVSENAVFFDRHDVSGKACTFLLPGRQYQLRNTAVVVEIKPPIQ